MYFNETHREKVLVPNNIDGDFKALPLVFVNEIEVIASLVIENIQKPFNGTIAIKNSIGKNDFNFSVECPDCLIEKENEENTHFPLEPISLVAIILVAVILLTALTFFIIKKTCFCTSYTNG